jgi:hypothetical protein
MKPCEAFAASQAVSARVRNIALTAQIQAAYASAIAARDAAQRAADAIEQTWPATWLRTLAVETYRLQAKSAQDTADAVLRRARAVCGLAFAHGY